MWVLEDLEVQSKDGSWEGEMESKEGLMDTRG